MNRQSHIVSFDDARRGARGYRGASDTRAYGYAASSRAEVRSDARGATRTEARGEVRGELRVAARAGAQSATRKRAASRDGLDAEAYGLRRGLHGGASGVAGAEACGSARTSSYAGLRAGARGGAYTGSRIGGRNGSYATGVSRSSARTSRIAAAAGSASPADLNSNAASSSASPSASEAASKTSFVGRMRERMGSAHRSRVKSKADRRFSQQYGESAGRGSSEPAGPRAAVYKGEMGSSHKKAARMQNDAPDKTRGRSALAKKRRTLSPALAVSVAIAACLALGCVSLYSPAQQYYQEIRERDRLQAEYAAVQQRNDAIQSEVDALSTSAGIEDRAREEFGWVKNDEVAGSVAGLDIEDDSSFRANIIPGSIEAPETWYSFLDPFFGVS